MSHLLVHSFIEEQFGCLHALAIIYNAAMNRRVQSSLQNNDSVSFRRIHGVSSRDHLVVLLLVHADPGLLSSFA